jgi:hypothetical protein
MNPQDFRNLQEAYLDVYDDDLTEEQEFKSWVTDLLDEGYDLSDYTWNEMYDIYNEEYKGGPEFGMKYSKPKPLSGEKNTDKTGYGGDEKFTKPDDKIEKPGTTVPPFKKGGYGRIMSNIPHSIGAHRDKIASRITTTTGGDPGAPTSQKMRPSEKKKNLEIIRKKTNTTEAVDLYDIILSHLLDEGYAETVENAESIMVNMSEDWRQSIFEEKKSLPVGKMRDKVNRMRDEPYIPGETAAQVRNHNRRLGNIEDVRRSVSTRGGKMKFPMPEVGRFKSKDD